MTLKSYLGRLTLQKVVWLFALLFFLILFIPSLFDKDEDLSYNPKAIEIKNSTITGYKDGKLSWLIKASYVWTGRSKYLFRGTGIYYGQLYDSNGKVIVDNLKAGKVRVNTKSKTLTAFENIEAHFKKRVDRKQFTEKDLNNISHNSDGDTIIIKSDELRYFSNTKKTFLTKNVVIKQGSSIIYPQNGIEIDNDRNVGYVEGGFQLKTDNYHVSGNILEIYIDDEYSVIKGGVEARRLKEVTENVEIDERERDLKESETWLYCDSMSYSSLDDNDVITVSGNIRIAQPDKTFSSEYGYYNKLQDYYELRDDVVITAQNLEWLLSKDKESFTNKDIVESLDSPVTVNAKHLTFNAKDKTLKIWGSLLIEQRDKTVTARSMIYDDLSSSLTFDEAVVIKKDKTDSMLTDQLIIDLENEAFFANKQVRTVFKLKETTNKTNTKNNTSD